MKTCLKVLKSGLLGVWLGFTALVKAAPFIDLEKMKKKNNQK